MLGVLVALTCLATTLKGSSLSKIPLGVNWVAYWIFMEDQHVALLTPALFSPLQSHWFQV